MILRAPARSGPAAHYAPAALAAVLMCGAILAIHHESLRTLVSAHGLLHTAIAQHFAQAWLPIERPENPFFAGEGLPYYWFYHYVGARLADTAGVHPLLALEALGLLAVTLVWISGAALGRSLDWGPGSSLAIGFLAFAGTNAFGSLFLLLKLASGRPWPADDGTYLWGLTHPVMGMVRWNDPGALYGPLINFFLNNSSRSLALSLSLVLVLAAWRYLERGTRLALAGVVVSAAACAACSPIIGPMAALALSAALACDRLTRPRDTTATRGRWRHVAVAALGGCAIPAPTYYHLFLRSTQPGVEIGFRPDLAATILVSAGPLLVLALVALARPQPHRRFLTLLVVAGTGLLCGNALLQVPGSNESNLFHLAGFLLAVPAAAVFRTVGGWAPAPRRIGGGLLLGLLASTPALVLWSYWQRPPVALAIDGIRLRAIPTDSPRAGVYECVRTHTPSNAVMVVDERLLSTSVLGNVPEFPALTGRAVFVAHDPGYLVNLYPDWPRRTRIASTLLSGRALDPNDRSYVDGLHRPLFLVVQTDGDGALAPLLVRYGAPACRVAPFTVFQAAAGAP